MSQSTSRLEMIMARVKNNPMLTALILVAVIVIGIASFTNGANYIMAITKSYLGLEVGDFAGRWKSSALIDQYNPDRRVYFEIELIVRDDRVFGTVTEITEINGSKSPRVFTANRPIREGKVDADFISFTVARSAALGQETVNYTDRYLGVLSGGLIDFTWQSDAPWGAAPQKFTAARQTLPMR